MYSVLGHCFFFSTGWGKSIHFGEDVHCSSFSKVYSLKFCVYSANTTEYLTKNVRDEVIKISDNCDGLVKMKKWLI